MLDDTLLAGILLNRDWPSPGDAIFTSYVVTFLILIFELLKLYQLDRNRLMFRLAIFDIWFLILVVLLVAIFILILFIFGIFVCIVGSCPYSFEFTATVCPRSIYYLTSVINCRAIINHSPFIDYDFVDDQVRTTSNPTNHIGCS